MAETAVEGFSDSLAALDVSMTRTDAASVAATIEDTVTSPAIGVPLGIDSVSLDDTDVETELTPQRLREAETGVTAADRGVAVYGSLLVRSDSEGTEPVSLYSPSHVTVVRESDVFTDIEASVERLGEIFSTGGSAVFATGVSSTSDMGAPIEGVHGPKNVHVVLVEDR